MNPNDAPLPANATTPAQRRRAFRLLFVCLTCLGMGQTIMFAVLPPLARQLALSEFDVGMIFVVSAVLWVVLSPWWGRRSDTMGRRPVILIGLMGFAVSTAAFAVVIDLGLAGLLSVAIAYPALIATRTVYGLLGPGAMPAAQAYVADRTTREERVGAVATLGAAFGLGSTLGPGLGAALVVLGLTAPFYGVALVAFASGAAIWFLLPERNPPRGIERTPQLSFRDPRVLPHIVVGLLIGVVQAVFIQTVGFYFIDRLNLESDQAAQMVGVGLMAASMAALFSQLVLVQRFQMTPKALQVWGVAITGVSVALMLVSYHYGPLVFALVLSGLGLGLVRPGNMAAASLSVGRHEQGATAGLISSTAAAGFVIAPLVGMPLYQVDPTLPYWLCLALMAVALVYVWLNPAVGGTPVSAPDEPDTGVPPH